MPQLMLPMTPKGTTIINGLVNVKKEGELWRYYLGCHPVYSHREEDHKAFQLVTSQLIDSGACRHRDIMKTFKIAKTNVNRSLKKYREEGIAAFYKERIGKKRGNVLTPSVLQKAQELLDQGHSPHETAADIKVRFDTFRKALKDGRLRISESESEITDKDVAATDKSARNIKDVSAGEGIGIACTRVAERTAAAFGKLNGAPVQFEASLGVPKGGVLCALPALLSNGLLEGAEEMLGEIKGYYSIFHLLLLLAFMALCRIKTVEKMRGQPPGEFGKLLGLDRIPEVRCLREKLDALSEAGASEKWAAHLGRHWMDMNPGAAGTLYIDGHTRVYNGKLTKLPRRFVSRERLCLRGVTDYWVNDAIGRPFFVVEKQINPGLLICLEEDIVPQLLKDVPDQPTDKELKNDKTLSRFTMVFDREGYSPDFFHRMWKEHRISCITYHKHPKENWPEDWFEEYEVIMPSGEEVKMDLAEMGTLVGSGKKVLWMREIRKLTESGHQTSVISTAYDLPLMDIGACMFTRWCQENFFRYMMEHFEIDMLQEYGVQDFPDTEMVVNPSWRDLDGIRKRHYGKLRYRRARFAEKTLHPVAEDDQKEYEKWVKEQSELLEEIQLYEAELENVKEKLKNTQKHILMGDLEEKDRFFQLLPGRKRLMDTIRMIAYRTETAMAALLVNETVDTPAARRLLQDLYVTDADILPDLENNLLRVRLHSASRPAANRSIAALLKTLNETETYYPGSDLKMTYELITPET